MKKSWLSSIILLCWAIQLQGQNVNFTTTYSIGGAGFGQVSKVIADPLDNVISVGSYNGLVDFDPSSSVTNMNSAGNPTAFVQKLDHLGNLLWASAFQSTGSSTSLSAAVDSKGSIYIMGVYRDSIDLDPGPGTEWREGFTNSSITFVVKLNAEGQYQWGFVVPLGANNAGRDIITDASDAVFITGQFNGQVDFDPGSDTFLLPSSAPSGYTHSYLQKLDSTGKFEWAVQIPASQGGNNWGRAICVNPNGDLYMAGEYSGGIRPDPINPVDISGGGGFDIYIAKYDAQGAFMEVQTLNGKPQRSYQHFVGGIAADPLGNIYLAGTFRDTIDLDPSPNVTALKRSTTGAFDAFALKLNADGDFQWAKTFAGPDRVFAEDIALSSLGAVIITGHFKGQVEFNTDGTSMSRNSQGEEDIYWIEMTSAGQVNWVGAAGGIGRDFGQSVATDNSGYIYGVGSYEDLVDFDPSASIFLLDALNDQDGFLTKLAPDNVGIKETSSGLVIQTFPNPFGDKVTLRLDQLNSTTTSSFGSAKMIVVTDATGRPVYATEMTAGAQSIELPLDELSNGLYQINVTTESGVVTLPVVRGW